MVKELVECELVTPEESDALALAHMHVQSWLEVYPDIQPGVTKAWVENHTAKRFTEDGLQHSHRLFKQAHEDSDHHFYKIAKLPDGTIAGLVTGSKTDEGQELEGMYVAKQYYGSGLAHQMISALFDWFDTAQPIKLWFTVGNDRARRFYEKYGFKVIKGPEKYFGDDKVMEIAEMVRQGDTE